MKTTTFARTRVQVTSLPEAQVDSGLETPTDAGISPGSRSRSAARTALWLIPTLAVAALIQALSVTRTAVATASAGVPSPVPAAVEGAAALISVLVLFFLARRLRLSRASATVACLIFALSPLAVQLTRSTPEVAIALPWLLTSFFLAFSRERQLIGFAGAALAVGIAVLLSPLTVIALPVLGWAMWSGADPVTRRYTIALAAGLLLVVVAGWEIATFVSGDAFDALGQVPAQRWDAGASLDEWWRLDPVLLLLAPAASILALLMRRLRPFGVLTLLVIAAIPLGAGSGAGLIALPVVGLLVVAVTETLLGMMRVPEHPYRASLARRIPAVAWCALVSLAFIAAVPIWSGQLNALFTSGAASTTNSTLSTSAPRTIRPEPTPDQAAEANARRSAASAGHDLALNPRLAAPPADLNRLASGRVDARVSIILGQLLATQNVRISGFPAMAGDTGGLARTVVITSVGNSSTQGRTATAATVGAELMNAAVPFRPSNVTPTPDGLRVTFSNQPFVSAG